MFDTNIPDCRMGIFDCMIPRISRYVICVGGWVGSLPGYGFRGSQLSRRTYRSVSAFWGIGCFAKAYRKAAKVVATAIPSAMPEMMRTVRVVLRRRLFAAIRRL